MASSSGSGPAVRTSKRRGRAIPTTACRCCASRSTPATRASARASRRCSRAHTRSSARSSAMHAIDAARTGPRRTSARRDPAAVRDRLGLSRTALEHAAYAHLDAAPHLRRFVTKALAMHLADVGLDRRPSATCFATRRGKRHGTPRVGRWYDFTRLPGRARSHTKERKWETFRLHGTLDGHRAAYTDRDGDFVQPRRLRAGDERRVVELHTARSRSCSAAWPTARWSCRSGCRPHRRTSRSSTTTWPIRAGGTRSIWCGAAIRTPPAAGATRRT